MASSHISATLFGISLAVFIQIAMGKEYEFYFQTTSCFNGETFNSTSPYASNLKTVINDLRSSTSRTGFATASAGNQKTERSYGLALCRGDISSQFCKACINQAGIDIANWCPDNKGAIIWYDYCLLKYSNTNFFGQIDMENKWAAANNYDVKYPQYFLNKALSLLRNVSEQAYTTPKLFGAGDIDIVRDQSTKLFGAVQCSGDLSRADCQKCLNQAISEISSCCIGKEGGRVVGASCNLRYEIYPFFYC